MRTQASIGRQHLTEDCDLKNWHYRDIIWMSLLFQWTLSGYIFRIFFVNDPTLATRSSLVYLNPVVISKFHVALTVNTDESVWASDSVIRSYYISIIFALQTLQKAVKVICLFICFCKIKILYQKDPAMSVCVSICRPPPPSLSKNFFLYSSYIK